MRLKYRVKRKKRENYRTRFYVMTQRLKPMAVYNIWRIQTLTRGKP